MVSHCRVNVATSRSRTGFSSKRRISPPVFASPRRSPSYLVADMREPVVEHRSAQSAQAVDEQPAKIITGRRGEPIRDRCARPRTTAGVGLARPERRRRARRDALAGGAIRGIPCSASWIHSASWRHSGSAATGCRRAVANRASTPATVCPSRRNVDRTTPSHRWLIELHHAARRLAARSASRLSPGNDSNPSERRSSTVAARCASTSGGDRFRVSVHRGPCAAR